MNKFIVDESVFEVFPDYCLGVVVAKGIDNESHRLKVDNMLNEEIEKFLEKYKSVNIREIQNIKAYREAFTMLGMNPNKYMCSIEAISKRVQKNSVLPVINPIVNIGNALSLKYILPVGAHDIDRLDSDIKIRFSTDNDYFKPMGENEKEQMPEGELIYVSGNTVKTRRWIWRQSDDGKITSETKCVFFPIDGFENVNGDQVLKARDELVAIIKEEYNCEVKSGYINKNQNTFVF